MKKICIVTGTRADYGLLYWTMKGLDESKSLDLQIVVTGMHLSSKFGETWKAIEQDGFKIDEKVDLGEIRSSRTSMLNQVSKGITGFAKVFSDLKPDLILVLGDRYEILAAGQTAMLLGIPLGHIHGGEITEGAFDDVIRHSLTKMSQIHFATTDIYKNRIIQMGEQPDNVFNVGAPGIENLIKLNLMDKDMLSNSIKFKLLDQNFLITYHPTTAVTEEGIDYLINVLKEYNDIGQIITMPNSDPGHGKIFKKLREYSEARNNVYLTESLGQLRYLSMMKIANCVIGNSSSGILEAPFSGTPTVNIGSRQTGRIKPKSVIDCRSTESEINSAINKALSSKRTRSYIYGQGDTSEKIIDILENNEIKFQKKFYDME